MSSNFAQFAEWAGARLSEPSTYKALAVLAGVVGVNIDPDQYQAIVTLCGLIYSAIGMFTRDPGSPR